MVSTQQLLALIVTAVLLGGCNVQGPPPQAPPVTGDGTPTEAGSAGGRDPAVFTAPRADTATATLALLDDSERARQAGDYDRASAYVERAIRLEPKRGDLWIELGEIELERGAPDQAERYARKGLSLAGPRIDWQRDAWLLIADAHDARGRHGEAQEIRARWRTYRG